MNSKEKATLATQLNELRLKKPTDFCDLLGMSRKELLALKKLIEKDSTMTLFWDCNGEFRTGDRICIIDPKDSHYNKLGTIVDIHCTHYCAKTCKDMQSKSPKVPTLSTCSCFVVLDDSSPNAFPLPYDLNQIE